MNIFKGQKEYKIPIKCPLLDNKGHLHFELSFKGHVNKKSTASTPVNNSSQSPHFDRLAIYPCLPLWPSRSPPPPPPPPPAGVAAAPLVSLRPLRRSRTSDTTRDSRVLLHGLMKKQGGKRQMDLRRWQLVTISRWWELDIYRRSD